MVISTNGCRGWTDRVSVIAQSVSGQRHEDVLQGGGARGERLDFRAPFRRRPHERRQRPVQGRRRDGPGPGGLARAHGVDVG